jgi:hypothetical protein
MTAVENSPNIRTIFGGHHPKKIIFDVFSAENNFFYFQWVFCWPKIKIPYIRMPEKNAAKNYIALFSSATQNCQK